MPTVLNAANEMAVAAFLEGRLNFMDIPRLVEAAMTAQLASGADEPGAGPDGQPLGPGFHRADDPLGKFLSPTIASITCARSIIA